jgi:hypothetical protein
MKIRSVKIENYAHKSFVIYKIKGKEIAVTKAPDKVTAKLWKEEFMNGVKMNLSGGILKVNHKYVPKKGPKPGSKRKSATAHVELVTA